MSADTPAEILRCDYCGRAIAELRGEICFGYHDAAPAVRLACKNGRCNMHNTASYDLEWFADPECAIRASAGASAFANLPAEGWARWMRVMWACVESATPANRERCREVSASTGFGP